VSLIDKAINIIKFLEVGTTIAITILRGTC